MALPNLHMLNYESLVDVELACNHGHHFTSDEVHVLLESLAREIENYHVIDGMGDPMSRQPPTTTHFDLTKLSPQDVGTPLPPSKRSQ